MRPWQVVAGGMLVILVAGCSSGSSESRAEPGAGPISSPDAEIFMQLAATEPQLAAVLRAVRRSKDVRRYQLVSRDEAYREFKRLFKEQPDLIASTNPDALPSSVRVTMVKPAALHRFASSVGKLPGVDEVKYLDPSDPTTKVLKKFCREHPPASPRLDAEVFMKVGATPDQVTAVRRRLRDSAAVKSSTYVSQAGALREFKRLVANSPDFASVPEVALPSSFRVELEDRGKRDQLRREVGELPGVDTVQVAGQLDALCR